MEDKCIPVQAAFGLCGLHPCASSFRALRPRRLVSVRPPPPPSSPLLQSPSGGRGKHRGELGGRGSVRIPLTSTVGPTRFHSHGAGHAHGHLALGGGDNDDDGGAMKVTWVGMGVNAGFGALKLGAGLACNSAALVADAAHSIGDLVSDAITIAALRAAKRPPDSEYPFG